MLCLARSILSYRAGFQILTRRPIPTTINWLTPLVRISNYADIRSPKISRAESGEKKLNRKAQKKALRTERRGKEKEEAKIPGTAAAIKAEIKAQKLVKKLERRARSKVGQAPTEEADIKAGEQPRREKEALTRKQAEPTRRQGQQEFKQRERSSEETPKRSWSGKKEEPRRTSLPFKTKAERSDFERSTRGPNSLDGTTAGSENRPSKYKSRDDKGWGTSWSPMETDALSNTEEAPRKRSKTPRSRIPSDNSDNMEFERGERTTVASFSRSSRRKDSKREEAKDRLQPNHRTDNTRVNANTSFTRPDRQQASFDRRSDRTEDRPWQGRTRDDTRSDETTSSTRPDHRQDSFGRRDRTERPHRSGDRGDRTATPFASTSRSVEPYEKPKREQWMVQKEAIKKKFGDEAWAPKKRLSPDTLEAIRTMHTSDPDKFSTPLLAEQFKVSPEVIRRILRTKWQPDEATVQDRQERWARRGERIWTKQAELGVRPPKKWREMGVAQTEPGVAPKWKKNAHTRDKYGEQPKHFVAQRKGASSGSVDIGFKKPFSERIL
jgi:hypothetical protein